MRNERLKEFRKDGHHRGEGYKGKDGSKHRGAKTFRRGRAIAFLEMMNLKRATIKQQLDQPEFQSIHQLLVGELKAIDMVINEFTQLFEIHEDETSDISDKQNEETVTTEMANVESLDSEEKGIEGNDTN
ncbi:hypothetical protein ACIQ2D_01470 [Lysinibacillus sp. NPDC097287]|uniref:hypothetical protein n=1 Tax=Lysinibacillus sp. NPDC097287 TaxID=3364144 RepID=UPI003812B40F